MASPRMVCGVNQPPERELNVGLRHALYNPDRLRVFHATQLLDTGADEMFDRLARLAGSLPRTPFAFITLVDAARSFWKSCIGVDSDDLADEAERRRRIVLSVRDQ